jgi:hypothetical protein
MRMWRVLAGPVAIPDRPFRILISTWCSSPRCRADPRRHRERFEHHILIRHECAEQLTDTPCDFDSLAAYLHARPYEGIVWHRPDGHMAKLKKRDFPA